MLKRYRRYRGYGHGRLIAGTLAISSETFWGIWTGIFLVCAAMLYERWYF